MTVEVRLVGPEGVETETFDPEEADALTRPTTVELLRAVAREEPASIRETARLVDRDVRQVHDNLWELGQLGLVEFDRSGRAHRPVVDYDRIEIEVTLRDRPEPP
ncbi:hypothetical protein [Natronomonas marina]|jgi:predicted transcriptional regulator|uniref:HVO_A0114 family putative DNA-binding protein n=1 Tax=Natronomonas marina TaxID=2961939 RepID=UPI0020C94152|nr:hypothetical protein [Natronomonas marina]